MISRVVLGTMVVGAISMAPRDCYAQEPRQGLGGFVFAYRAREGQRREFDRGYRQHLEWHRQAGDTLAWYGWDVLTGDQIGLFVDGVFGASLEAVDRRVDPAGDQRNLEETAGLFAEPTFRRIYALRPTLSSDLFLEERRPSPLVQVFTIEVDQGGVQAVERLLAAARSARTGRFAVYQVIDGGSLRQVMVLAPRNGMRELTTLADLLTPRDGPTTGEGWGPVRNAQSETWLYRSDLTYLPPRTSGR